jgi:alkylation response protein AidB-like acyl-CoA dehydrogenase
VVEVIDADLTLEQVQLRHAVRELLAEEAAPPTFADLAARDALARRTWGRMVAELGIGALAVTEELGGAGGSWADVCVVLDETGRALSPAAYLSTSCVLATLAAIGEGEAAASALSSIASGGQGAALALLDEVGSADPSLGPVARSVSGRTVLDGARHFVVDGSLAEVLLVSGRLDSEPALFLVAADAAGLTRDDHVALDPTRGQSTVYLDAAPALLVSRPGEGAAALAYALQVLQVGTAVEACGAASACLETTVGYLKTREQFGRPLASFQALQHRCADLAVLVEAAASTAWYASSVVTSGSPELAVVAPLAKAVCVDASWQVAAESIQMHGGIGFTWEHPAHLYFKRATSSGLLYGTSRELRRTVGELAGILGTD